MPLLHSLLVLDWCHFLGTRPKYAGAKDVEIRLLFTATNTSNLTLWATRATV
jgi:hypothetical protein